ncbi:protocadherin fat 4 [Plakobranchus ocellatus]|uniref:Protocadherin fat 4 n=1 Tax=Plakobranchus ocellatus TaxID=259542 RepID=A0AAV4DJ29_9GAST|nr:protocadherin fat 4 [Plakobranchus ocellatus]
MESVKKHLTLLFLVLVISISVTAAVSGLVVDANTCDVYVAPGLDYETSTTLTGTITVEDKTGLKDVESFTFTVSDANDNAPVCDPSTLVAALNEDAAAGTTIGTFACTDADQANTINSEIEFLVFPVINSIEVNTTTGEATLKRTIDYETDGPSITATVRVYDKGSMALTSTVTVVLQITDLDDNVPVFDSATFTDSQPEDTPVGTTLIRLGATDADQANTVNSQITFGLWSACSPDLILLDPLTGDLVLKSTLDYEVNPSVTCDLYAYSSTNSNDRANATFTLTVTDVNEQTPTFTQTFYTANITENDSPNTVVIQLNATDNDGGVNGQVTYAMTDVTSTFQIDSNTGEVKVQTAPNYEMATSYLFLVTAEDGAATPKTASIYLQILVDPVNEFTPAFLDSQTISGISEDTIPGTVIHNISISDDDAGVDGAITYTVLTANVPFFVDIAGAIRVASDLNYETQTSYEFVVQASDSSATTVKSATATYSVDLVDADDEDLSCEPVSTIVLTGASAENLNFVQASLNCSDPDTSAGTLMYSIADGNADNAWTVNAGGQVSLQSEPSTTQYNLSISVTDGTNSTTVSFTVFTETTLTFTNVPMGATTVNESTSGTTLLTASACCAFGEITYTIVSGNTDNKVSMVSSTGEIKHLLPYDRETTASYEYVIEAVSTSGQTATATYSVTVGDENDNTPLYAQNVYQISVAETLAALAPIATFTATDADDGLNANLVYSIVSGNSEGKFSLNSGTGLLGLADTLNFDVTPSYELVMQAVDQGDAPALTGSTTVVVSVVNAEDSAPTIIPLPGTYTVNLSEDVALGKSVFDVEATDGDNGTSFTFSIESGNTDSDFGIDPSSGYIFVSKFLDRERTDTYTLVLTAVDSLFSSTATGTLTVSVDDVNDNDPVFTPSVFEFDVPHDTGPGVSVGDIVVSDDDAGANAALTTTIIAGNTGTAFELDGLQVKTLITMDYTTTSLYRITLQAVDSGMPARTTTTVMVINVLPDVQQPDFGATTSDSIDVNEDAEVGSQLYDVDATFLGAVEGDGSTLYSIISGDPTSRFGVRSQYGQVYLAAELDFEMTVDYTLVIQAQNSVQTTNTADFTLTVNVVNINEHDPIFDQISNPGQNSFSFDVDELSASGTFVGQVSATDDDSGNAGTVVHTLSGSSDFTIASDTGIITVSGTIDYSVQSVYNLIVTATDQGNTARSDSVSVVVRVIDVNNNNPVFTSATTAQVLDSAPAGSEFFHVHATDADTDAAGSIKYSIVADPSVGKLSLDADTGILSVAGQLDAALESSYVLTIKAADEGVPSLETTQPLTVTVVSTVPNYYSPSFPTDPVSASVSREASIGTAIVAVSATDSDSGASGEIIHRIIAGNSDGYFLIDRTTGAISTGSSVLNAENSYSLTVEACDLGVPSQSTSVTVNIAVSPSRTILTTPDYNFTIAEDANVNDLVGEILVDTGRTTSAYTIASGNFDTSFSIARDGGTGRGLLTTAKALDFETFPLYSLLINVDTDIGAYTKVVEVSVTDVNDNPPTFSSNSLTLTINENMPVGYTVTTISVSDADTDAINRDNLLSLSNPGPDLFSIDQSGHLTLSTSPDFETVGAQRIFDVVAADQQPPQTSATVTVTVNIVDVVETEDRPLSSITTTSLIPLEVHYPATNGDIIHIFSPGDFGIEEVSGASVEFVTIERNYPFSISTSGEVTVSDANSLSYPGKYFHWALCRSTVNGTTTSRVSLIRLDTYDRDNNMAVIEFSESLDNVRSRLDNFRFRAKEFLSANQRIGISLLLDTSTDTRRRLLATRTAAYTYVVSDTSIDDLANIAEAKQFFTEAEILAVYQKNTEGAATNGLSTSSMSIDVVEPFDDRNGSNDFATSTTGIALWALLGVFVLVLILLILACVWWRKTRDPKKWNAKKPRKKMKTTASNTASFLTINTDRTPPSSAPSNTILARNKHGQFGASKANHKPPKADGATNTGKMKPNGSESIDKPVVAKSTIVRSTASLRN